MVKYLDLSSNVICVRSWIAYCRSHTTPEPAHGLKLSTRFALCRRLQTCRFEHLRHDSLKHWHETSIARGALHLADALSERDNDDAHLAQNTERTHGGRQCTRVWRCHEGIDHLGEVGELLAEYVQELADNLVGEYPVRSDDILNGATSRNSIILVVPPQDLVHPVQQYGKQVPATLRTGACTPIM